jgi:hypothetical protein
MAAGFTMALDTKEFDKVLDAYMVFQKRAPADVINTKLYYIARNATSLTKHSDKGKIETELRGKARDYDAPLAAVMINSQLGAKGEKGLYGPKMEKAISKLIRQRKASVNFVRSGWKNAIVMLEAYLRQKGELTFARRWQSTAPVDKATMSKKNFEKLGKATVARIERGPRVWGEIQNDIGGKDSGHKAELANIKQDGLQKAVDKEVASMRVYLDRKFNPVHQEFNRKMGFR